MDHWKSTYGIQIIHLLSLSLSLFVRAFTNHKCCLIRLYNTMRYSKFNLSYLEHVPRSKSWNVHSLLTAASFVLLFLRADRMNMLSSRDDFEEQMRSIFRKYDDDGSGEIDKTGFYSKS